MHRNLAEDVRPEDLLWSDENSTTDMFTVPPIGLPHTVTSHTPSTYVYINSSIDQQTEELTQTSEEQPVALPVDLTASFTTAGDNMGQLTAGATEEVNITSYNHTNDLTVNNEISADSQISDLDFSFGDGAFTSPGDPAAVNNPLNISSHCFSNNVATVGLNDESPPASLSFLLPSAAKENQSTFTDFRHGSFKTHDITSTKTEVPATPVNSENSHRGAAFRHTSDCTPIASSAFLTGRTNGGKSTQSASDDDELLDVSWTKTIL